MNYDPFVIPFCAGAIILIITLAYKYLYWIFTLNNSDKLKILKGIFSIRIFKACKEVFLESLIHRKVFKVNPLLGYMHMSFAFGWLLLILGGTVESKIHSHRPFNLPYEPIFFKFFNHDISMYPWADEFKFLMDFLLLFVLSGVVLAFIKRIYSRFFGMKKTTRLKIGDWMALIALWLIFPLRFFAESFTSGLYHNGGFLTGTAGNFFALFLPLQNLSYVAWWAYSLVLCAFLIALPYSRYMHIFTEVVLIFLRNFGIRDCKIYNSFSAVEVYSCSRCGICIDKCQLLTSSRIKDTQSVYFLQSIRHKSVKENKAFDCLLCGRCQEYCPVGINLNNIRISQRFELSTNNYNFDYIPPVASSSVPVLYFAGCMTHLTPSVKIAMEKIFEESATKYYFIDKDGGICCGRPLMVSGEIIKAHRLIEKNRKLIIDSGAKTLVTSCPICLKVFKEDYLLNNMEVIHHSQYLLRLVEEQKIKLNKLIRKPVGGETGKRRNGEMEIIEPSPFHPVTSSPFPYITAVYHDPCELGRGCSVYNEPRELLEKIVNLQTIKNEKGLSMCCGSSMGGINLTSVQRDAIRMDTVTALQKNKPDLIVTACPLCKKTLAKSALSEVKDISELALISINSAKDSN